MKLIDLLPAEQRRELAAAAQTHRQTPVHAPRPRGAQAALCLAWTCLSMPARAGASCTPAISAAFTVRGAAGGCSRTLLNPAEVSISAMLEHRAAESDALYGVPRWLLTRAFNAAEDSSAATLEDRAAESDALYSVPQAVPILEDVGDPCLRW